MIELDRNKPSAWLARRKDWKVGEYQSFNFKPDWACETIPLYKSLDCVEQLKDENQKLKNAILAMWFLDDGKYKVITDALHLVSELNKGKYNYEK